MSSDEHHITWLRCRADTLRTRSCRTQNCRNVIRLNTDDKLCEQCLGPNGFSSSKDKLEEGELPSEGPHVGPSDPPAPNIRESRDRNGQPFRRSSSHAATEAPTDPYAAHVAMLDERQQNRARKLERETEEVDGRWRTIQSTTTLLGSPPPRSSHSRKPETDRVVTVDAYRPNGLSTYRPHEIDTYRPGRSPVHAHGSTHIDRLYERSPRPSLEPAPHPLADVPNIPVGPSNKRKLEVGSAPNDGSNKSSVIPSQSTRCGKRNCLRFALPGKDRCQPCYTAEGRHPGVSVLYVMSRQIKGIG